MVEDVNGIVIGIVVIGIFMVEAVSGGMVEVALG
jgi:uncharacterized membrane protein